MGWRWAPVTDFMAEMISDLQKPEGIAGSAAEVTAPPLQLLDAASFGELAAQKLQLFERELRALNIQLFPEARARAPEAPPSAARLNMELVALGAHPFRDAAGGGRVATTARGHQGLQRRTPPVLRAPRMSPLVRWPPAPMASAAPRHPALARSAAAPQRSSAARQQPDPPRAP